jgi:serine/threonine protein kinase
MNFGSRLEIIGKGAYTIVYKTTNNYAVKVCKKKDENEGISYIREILILNSLNHPHIIKLLDTYITPTHVFLYMDLAICSLQDNFNKKDYSNSDKYLYQLIHAIHYCHKNNVIHRDIKPANILVYINGDNKYIKLTDFGLSRMFVANDEVYTEDICSLWWRAPEIFAKEKYSYCADIWSYGIIFWTFQEQNITICEREDAAQYKSILDFLNKPGKKFMYEPITSNLLSKMVTWSSSRYTADEILNDPYFVNIKSRYPINTTNTTNNIIDTYSINSQKILVDKIYPKLELCRSKYNLKHNTLNIATKIYEKVLSKNILLLDTRLLYVYAYVSLYIACKLLEVDILKAIDILTIIYDECNYTSNINEIFNIEQEIYLLINYTIPINNVLQPLIDI